MNFQNILKINKRKVISFVGSLVLLTLISGLMFKWLANPVGAAWFDDLWGYRKAVTVTVTSSSADISELETLITVDTTGITDKLQTSCQDLRFTNQNGDVLPYYIDTCSDNSATNKIWVLIDLVPKNTTKYTMYMYYGNPTATAATDSTKFYRVRGLVGYWTMNEASWNGTSGEVKDSSVNANNGTAAGNATTTSSGSKYSNSGTLDGTGDYFSLGDPSQLEGLATYSIGVWINPANTSGDQNFVHKDLVYQMQLSSGVLKVASGTQWAFQTSSSIPTSTWTHIIMTWDGDKLYVYINGTLTNTFDLTNGSLPSNTKILDIGRNAETAAEYFNGKLDDLRFYNRDLSAAEVLDLYSNPGSIATTATGTSLPSTSFGSEQKSEGPVAYWDFNEGTGTTTRDQTANNNVGTVTGATWQTEDLCISGKCLKFDGVDDRVNMGTGDHQIGGSSGASFSIWVRLQSVSGTQAIFQKSAAAGWAVYLSGTQMGIYNNTVNKSTEASLSTNKWTQLTWVFNGGTVTYYKDGESLGSTTGSGSTITNESGASLCLGIRCNDNAEDLNGFLDDVKIYNYARSAAQIKADFAGRGASKGTSAVLGSNIQNLASGNLSNGLVGYWKMDETASPAVDSSGGSNSGTWTGNATSTTGKFSNGLVLDGTGDYVSISSTTPDLTGHTFSAWVKTTSSAGWANSDYMMPTNPIIHTAVNSGGSSAHAGFGIVSGKAASILDWTTAQPNESFRVFQNGVKTVNDGSWHQIVWVIDKANNLMTLYVDGQKDIASSITGFTSNAQAIISIGRVVWWAGSSEFNGSLDEVRLYNRAFSPSEVSQLYNFAPGPVGYWDFEDGTGASVSDRSGNAYTGTWNGTGATHWTQGKYGKAGKFNGSDDYVSSAQVFATAQGGLTLSTWANPSAISGGTIDGVIGNSGSYFVLEAVSGSWRGRIYNGSTNVTGSGGTQTSNQWDYLTMTWDGTTMRVYKNSILQSSTTVTTPQVWTGGISIGTLSADTTYTFPGQIDDVKIYNYARTPKQIVEDMNAGHPSVGSPVGSALAHYKFNEGTNNTCSGGTNDACNSGNGGSVLDGAGSGFASPATSTSGWTSGGKFGKALLFDGSNDYINVADNSALEGMATLTVSAWIKANSGQSSYNYILTKQNSSVDNLGGYEINLNTSGHFCAYFDIGNSVKSTCSQTNYFDATWHHVLASYDGSTLRVFVDGVQKNSVSATGSIGTSSIPLTIGVRNDLAVPFAGTIDEVKIYNYDLTANEVKTEYNREAAQVLGALGSNSTYQPQANNQIYCVPGDSTSCAAPVGEWKFEEGSGTSVNDSSGNANTGTWNGTAPYWTQGKYGKAGKFNGSDDYVDITDSTSLDIGTSDFTITAWIKNAGSGSKLIFDKYHDSPVGGYQVYLSSTNQLSLWLVDTGYGGSSGSALNDNIWHYVAVAGDRDGNAVFYVDGKVDKTVSISAKNGVDLGTGQNANIGRQRVGAQLHWNGNMDQVRLYNYARSAAQIAWDYNQGDPVGHWKFDECQGTVANDASGNGNVGTITIGATGTQTTAGTCTTASTAWGNGATGKYNSSLNFDGTDDIVSTSYNSIFDITNSITLSAWYKKDVGSGTNRWLIDKGPVNSSYAMFIEGGLKMRLEKPVAQDCTVTEPSEGVWHHAVSTYDGTNMKVYVDGQLINTCPGTGTITNSAGGINIGAYSGPGYMFKGQIDDVRVYNYGLTATQVKTLYNQGSSVRFGPVTGTP